MTPKFEDYKIVFEDGMRFGRPCKNLVAIRKSDNTHFIIGQLSKEREGYSSDGEKISNRNRILYNFSWIKEGLYAILGHDKVTIGSKRVSPNSDLFHFSSYHVLPFKYFKDALQDVFNKYNSTTSLSEKILKEAGEEEILNTKIENPETGRKIKVASALTYDDSEPVKKKAQAMLKKSNLKVKDEVADEISTNSSKPKNSRSHKKAGRKFGINKEIKELLKQKGFPMLTAFPQTFVKPDELVFNPKLNATNKDKVWVLKFPALDKFDRVVTKTVYTPGFMLKSKVKNFKKISKIKSSDIESFEEKTKKLLNNKNKEISDAACVIRIILKTGLRIGSQDNPDTGSIGTRTLQVKNLTMNGNKIRFDFIGKSAQQNIAELDDEEVAKYLQNAIKGKSPNDRLFNVSYEHTAKLMSKINPKGINPKDLRAYKGTQAAKNFLQSKEFGVPPPVKRDKKILIKQVRTKLKHAFEYTANVLNNTPSMAKNSYIHPVVIEDWIHSMGLTPKQVGYKHVMVKDAKLYPEERQLIETSKNILKIVENKEVRKIAIKSILKIAQTKTITKINSLTEALNLLKEFDDEEEFEPHWTTLDEMFEKYADYGKEINYNDISDEESYDCEEYPLPEWVYDEENWELV